MGREEGRVTSNIDDVKRLRKETLAGVMDCKTALQKANGDFDEARKYLKIRGLAIADKKSSRVALDGLVAAFVSEEKDSSSYGVIIELNSETDFVARSDKFQTLLNKIANVALTTRPVDVNRLKNCILGESSVEQEIVKHVGIIGEKLQLSKFASLHITEGVIASYVHGGASSNAGMIAAIVSLESAADKDKLNDLGRKIAMHIVASNPLAVSVESLPSDLIEKERELIQKKVSGIGKSDEVLAKIINGKLNKYYSAVVLLKQKFVMMNDITIEELLNQSGKEFGFDVKIVDYKLFVLADGKNHLND